jgi:hypothetical protein
VSGRPDFDPNKAMQSEIAAALDGEIALPRKQRDALNEQKTALMQKLLTGEVRLKEFRE